MRPPPRERKLSVPGVGQAQGPARYISVRFMPEDRSPEHTRGVGQGADSAIALSDGPPLRPGGGFAPVASLALGVGQFDAAIAASSGRFAPPCLPPKRRQRRGSPRPCASCACGVVQALRGNPDPHAVMRRADGASRNPKRPPGVAQGFQIKQRSIEPQIAVTINVFEKTPSGSCFDSPEEASDVRPEIAIIRHAAPHARDRERLAGISPGPQRPPVGPSGEPGGEPEAADPGEEVDLGISPKIGSLN